MDSPDNLADDQNRWILFIKELRATHDCGILDAERMALSYPHWKRWVERRINGDPQCRQMARHHMHYNGDASLIIEESGALLIRQS